MAKAIRIRRAPFLILLPVQSKGQNTPQSISFGRQGGGESLRSILSLKAATKSLISSQKCSNCRSFHFDHTEALQSRWRNGEGFAARLDHSRVGPTFHQVFPSIQSERKHAWGRRRANLVRPNAAASDTLDSQGSLLPADVLADLRQKGVTIWEFYYDTSAETYGVGNSGEEVRALQGYLMTTGHFHSEHGATGYFGPDTQKALSNWQRQHGVEPALGVWGPFSRDRYRQLVAQDASRRGVNRQSLEKPVVRIADRPGPTPPRAAREASPSTTSASVSVPVSPAGASHAHVGLSLTQSLMAAVAIVGGAVAAGVLLQRNKASPRVSSDAEEMARARNMLEMDRTGGPQPGEREAGRRKAAPEER